MDIRFKTVPNAEVKLWPLEVRVVAERAFRENGAERVYTAIVKVGFCHLKCVLKSLISRNGQSAVRV